MKNEKDYIPNVLPLGVLEPVENDELIIAQLKYESEKGSKEAKVVSNRRSKNG